MKIAVHCHVDLDACACVAFAGADINEVGFLPAGATVLPPELEGVRVLDHELGEKGQLAADGTRHAAVLAMPEVNDLVGSALLAEIDEQDRRGQVAQPRFSLAVILGAIRETYATAGLSGAELDRAVLTIMVPILRGLAQRERGQRATQESGGLPKVKIGAWQFEVRDEQSLSPPPKNIATSTTPSVGVIFHDVNGLGVMRLPGQVEPDLTRLAPHLPGWFVHPAGFLACWGSRKSPAQSPPPPGTPQNVPELLDLLRSILQ